MRSSGNYASEGKNFKETKLNAERLFTLSIYKSMIGIQRLVKVMFDLEHLEEKDISIVGWNLQRSKSAAQDT